MEKNNRREFTENEISIQNVALSWCERIEEVEENTLEFITNFMKDSGLPILPADFTRTHETRECYFVTADKVACHLVICPKEGYELNVLAKRCQPVEAITGGEKIILDQLKRMAKLLNLRISHTLQDTLDLIV